MRRPPNILFFLAEHHRWDWLGLNRSIPVRTPNLDRLARRGVRFTECRCSSPLCAPSRAGLATGLRYHRAGVPDNHTDLDPERLTFMQLLRDAGYRVAAVGKTDLHKRSHLHGITGWSERLQQLGFTETVDMCGKRDSALTAGIDEPIEPYMAWLHEQGLHRTVYEDLQERIERDMNPADSEAGITTRPFPLPRRYQIDDFCGRKTLELLETLPVDQPWFLQVNWAGAHPPFDAAEELLQRYEGVSFPGPVEPGDDPSDHQAVRRQYAAMLEGMDEWIGWVIDAVEERGELDDTVIFYSADHGEMLGDYGRWNKGQPLEPSVHVPLIAAGPTGQQTVPSDALVELIDLAATFLDLAQVELPPSWDARSLLPVLSGERTGHRKVAVSALGGWEMIYDGRYKYVEAHGEPSALHDLETDPEERLNLVGEGREVEQRLAQQIQGQSRGNPA